MACIGKISATLVMSCGTPASADLSAPVSAKILNASDIASFTVGGSAGAAGTAIITRIPGARGYDITTVNNSMVVTVGLKSQDIMPGAYDVSITFKSFSGAPSMVSSPAPMGVVGNIERAELVFAVDHGDTVRVYGLGAPLVCTEISGDSSASGFITYTYGVEDWQVGTTIHNLSRADYEALSTPAASEASEA